jgi:DNA-binding transcriptional ArsR family regulator
MNVRELVDHPVRGPLLEALGLSRAEMTIGSLALVLRAPQTAVSRAVQQLRQAGLVVTRSEGTKTMVSLPALTPQRAAWAREQARILARVPWERDVAHIRRVFVRAKGLVFQPEQVAAWLSEPEREALH